MLDTDGRLSWFGGMWPRRGESGVSKCVCGCGTCGEGKDHEDCGGEVYGEDVKKEIGWNKSGGEREVDLWKATVLPLVWSKAPKED